MEEKGASISQFMGKKVLKGIKAFSSIPHFAFKEVLFSQHFELSIIIPIMRSMNYFGQVILEILENNQLKSYFGDSSEITILSPFLEIS